MTALPATGITLPANAMLLNIPMTLPAMIGLLRQLQG
jgi:hypothetical protein